MKLKIFFLLFLPFFLYAQNCELYFEARKAQMAVQIQEYDEAKQELESFRASFEALQKERLQELAQKEKDINASLAKIEKTKADNEEILKKTKAYLATINKKTTGKITEIYGQMKAKSVAAILSEMDNEDASKMLLSMQPRAIAGIISKMDPKKASELSLLLKNMDANKSKLKEKKQ